MAGQDVSFDPDDALEGGGGVVQAVSGATLTFECVAYDYNGSIAVAVPALHVHGEYQNEEGEGAEFEEYYSAGDASKLRSKKDGTGFQALTEGAGMTKTCKAMQFISSIVSANGGDKSIITGNIKDLDGLNADLERKADIDRPGLETREGARKRTILLVSNINSLPGEAPKAKAGKGKGKPAAGKPSAGKAIRIKTIEAINGLLAVSDVAASDLPQALFRKFKKDPDVKAMTELAADEEFIAADDTPWGFDGDTLTSGV
jgi:hypothetical protein